MNNWLSRLLPLASRTRPTDAFVEQFQKTIALAVSATGQVALALQGKTEQALAGITEIEHQADDAVRQVNRLVDQTFIPPYDKRDIVLLSHRLDDIVDGMRTVVRQIVGYRAMEATDSQSLAATALSFTELIRRAASEIKRIVDAMPAFDHDEVRAAVRTITGIEDEGDELFAQALHALFPDPNQPLTAAMLAWRDIFRQMERITDHCEHAIKVIVSIARQEGH